MGNTQDKGRASDRPAPGRGTGPAAAGHLSGRTGRTERPGRGTKAAHAARSVPPPPQVPSLGEAADGDRFVPTSQLQSILDALPYYVLIIDEEHTILMANEATHRELGVDHRSLVGHYCPKAVHGCEGAYPGCPLEQARQSGGTVELEYQDREHDKIISSGIFPTRYRTAEGRRVYLHLSRDITSERRNQDKLRRNHEVQRLVNDVLRIALEPIGLDEILTRILDQVMAIPWLAQDPRGAVFLVDPVAQSLRLIASHGFDDGDAMQCTRVPLGECPCGKAAESGQVVFDPAHECGRRHAGFGPHGHYCVPIVHGENVLGVLTVCVHAGHQEDTSELEFLSAITNVLAGILQRKHAELLQREHERLALSRDRMARVGMLSAGLAHTVRNPLHGVMSCLEILESQAQRREPAGDEIISLMRDGLIRIERTTRRLLALTRESIPERAPTSIGDLLHDVVGMLGLQARQRSIDLVMEAEFVDEAVIHADGVVEALSAALTNALDACGEGGRITVRSRLTDDPVPALLLEVEDTGRGITEDNLERVLDPFFTTKPVGEGSGLGLTIARRVMDEHGGDLQISSRSGEGTRVTFRFPDPSLSSRARSSDVE